MTDRPLIHLITEAGCVVKFRSEVPEDWDFVYKNLSYRGVMEADNSLYYQQTYFQSKSWADMSMVCYKKDGTPCSIISLHLHDINGLKGLSAAGLPIEPLQFAANVSKTEKQRICRAVVRGLKQYHAYKNFPEFKCYGYCNGTSGTIDEWYKACIEVANSVSVGHRIFIDLEQDVYAIKASFRKSYKSLINKSKTLWTTCVLGQNEITKDEWKKFKYLHFEASNRVQTRSDESWQNQYLQILQGSAFLITLHSRDNLLVGGGFFQYTQDEGMYSVAAYDRSLFDKPLGHLVQWIAINEFKRLGIKKYWIGDRPYLSDTPSPSQKEINIGYFKEGFSETVSPRFCFTFKT